MYESQRFLEEFIECYKSHASLWDVTCRDHAREEKKVIGYIELLRIMRRYNRTAKILHVKMKINTLRSGFRRELLKVRQSEASVDRSKSAYVPSIWWYNNMEFLAPVERPLENRSEVAMMHDPLKQYEFPESPQTPKKRKRTRTATASGADNLPKQEEQEDPVKCSQAGDDVDNIAKSWALQFRQLPPEQQRHARRGIEEVLLLGLLGRLSHESSI